MTFPSGLLSLCFASDDDREDIVGRSGQAPSPVPTFAGLSLSVDDAAVVAQIQGGDASAFERIFKGHAKALVTFAAGYVRSRATAEDIVADVFATLWERRATWNPANGVRAYLYAAVRNRSLNNIRNLAIHARVTDWSNATPTAPRAVDDALIIEEQLALIRRTIQTFPEQRRRIMALRWRDGLSASEIATVLGLTRNAVDIQLTRALQALKALLPTLLE